MWGRLTTGQRVVWGILAWLWSIPLVMGLLVLGEADFSTGGGAFMAAVIYMLPLFLVEMIVGREYPFITFVLYIALVAGLTWLVWRKTRKPA